MFAPVMSMGTVDAYGNLGSNGGGVDGDGGGQESLDSNISCDFIAMFTHFDDNLLVGFRQSEATCIQGGLQADESCSSASTESPDQGETIQVLGDRHTSGSVVLVAIKSTWLVLLTAFAMTSGAFSE
jgi:hypothetical protein